MQQVIDWCATYKVELIIASVALLAIVIGLIIGIHKYKHSSKYQLFKFRRYKKFEGPPDNRQQHPKLIVEETDDEYGFMGITESKKHGHANNLPIENPQKGNTRESYIRKEVRYDSKDNFFEILKNYKLTREDKKKIIAYLENRKKKK